MANFFHRLFNPHCEFCADEERTRNTYFEANETLKKQLELANIREQQLLDRLTAPPPQESRPSGPPEMVQPRYVPWNVRRQMLEAEDRAKARAATQAGKPDIGEVKPQNLEELEKELGVVGDEVKENV